MHLDEEAAKKTMLGGLSGSGWHLVLADDADAVRRLIGRAASLGSPGVNELRWLAPLRPGDDVTLEVDVTEASVSRSRPETGIVTFKGTTRNAAARHCARWSCRSSSAGAKAAAGQHAMDFFEDRDRRTARVGLVHLHREINQDVCQAIRSAALSP